MEDQKIIALMEGYTAGTLSEEDAIVFFQWYSQAPMGEFDRLFVKCKPPKDQLPVYPLMPDDFRIHLEQAIRDYEAEQRDHRMIPLFRRYRWGWAAAILLLIGAGGYIYFNSRQAISPGVVHNQPASTNDVAPGTTKAVLTLADGSRVLIDSARNGELAVQGKTTVLHNQGVIAYNRNTPGQVDKNAQRPLFNTLTTNRGEQSPPLILSDGTKVWLNALSSIRFPVAFTGNSRNVEITGEVFFEIASLPLTPSGGGGTKGKMPFIVSVNGKVEVEALGTQFNVNAYADEESIKTTLIEGAVRVRSEAGSPRPDGNTQTSVILKPGEQAVVTTNNKLQTTNSVDINQVIAWKNGVFDFNHANLQTVLKQLARWYDIDVKFEGPVPTKTYRGKITRDQTLSQMIKILQDVEVNFRIEGRTLIVAK
jgi:transmembrane sensor